MRDVKATTINRLPARISKALIALGSLFVVVIVILRRRRHLTVFVLPAR